MEEPKKVIFEISLMSVAKVILLLIGVWLLYVVKDVLVILLVVLIISISLEPFVGGLAKQGIPRGLSIIVLYILLLVVLGGFVYFIAPPVASQIKELTLNLPYYASKLNQVDFGSATSSVSSALDNIASSLTAATGGVVNALFSIFGGVVSAITVFALTYYFLSEEEGIKKAVSRFLPVDQKARFYSTLFKMSEKLGDWLRGQLTVMAIVGLLDGIALWGLGIRYALVLGILAAFIEVIPIIGPIVAGAAAVFVAFVSGVAFWKIIAIVIIYTLVQQVESHILIPKIMQKAIGLSPIVVIIAILVGFKLLGIGGAILAVPVAAGIMVFVQEYMQLPGDKAKTI